jgi:serine protease inhibitor
MEPAEITRDPKGTKAGAATLIKVNLKSVEDEPDKRVILDRPFIYAIIDSKTNIPIFLGVVSDMNEIKE